jgi:SAM-dependent methyltransferase
MSAHDRDVNRQLAHWLFTNVLHGKPGRVLDVGCGEPVLAQSLAELGCEAIGLDVDPRAAERGRAAGIPTIVGDVLALDPGQILGAGRGRALPARSRWCTCSTGSPIRSPRCAGFVSSSPTTVRVFLRLPDHAVAGSDRYMQRRTLDVAPLMHTFSGLLELCVQTADLFSIERTYALDGAGQRDVVLRRSRASRWCWPA